MTYALLKNKDTIVRVVGERALDNTYTVMMDHTEIYDFEKAVIISQDDIEELERNLNLLQIRIEHRTKCR